MNGIFIFRILLSQFCFHLIECERRFMVEAKSLAFLLEGGSSVCITERGRRRLFASIIVSRALA